MHGNKDCIVMRVGSRSAIFVRWIGIVVARHNDVVSLPFEISPYQPRKPQDDVFLHDPVWSLRAVVGSAVRGVDDNRRANVHGSCGSLRGRSGILLR